ncbi:MAG: type II toxin-antitoxin system VapC family toxin [Anaerolineales bacterium]
MNVVDSSGWIEYFTHGKNAQFFIPPVQDLAKLLVPSLCIYEVFKRLLMDLDEDAALLAVGLMSQGQEVVLERKIAIDAAHLSRELKLAMADSIILATARAYNATLWTQDAHFKALDGVNYFEK